MSRNSVLFAVEFFDKGTLIMHLLQLYSCKKNILFRTDSQIASWIQHIKDTLLLYYKISAERLMSVWNR